MSTVSNVLNHPERVSPTTMRRVQDAAAKVGFVRSDAARQLGSGASACIGLVLPDPGMPYYAELARGAELEAARSGFSLLVGAAHHDLEREGLYLDFFHSQRVRGIVMSATENPRRLEELRRRGISAVLIDTAGPASPFSSVSIDDVAGGQLAVEHLLDEGKRRIAFLGGLLSSAPVAARLRGAMQAVAACPGAELQVISTSGLTVLAGRCAGEEIASRPACERPDGVFCADDLLGIGVLQGLCELAEVAVPGEVAVVGFDDIPLAQSTVIPLSSVRRPGEMIGRMSVELLLAEVEDGARIVPRHISCLPRIVVRSSTVARSV
ncbi:hypothetical protein AX769_22325 (plasmid) [Frondihabitans sp. PAMC 28766]|nr:hypothetical protein AX769_22325 [Frondihabitans sp. PAMC 28766]